MANQSLYPAISDYGLISDMHSCALISKSGSIDWCCLPRFDSPSIFGRILDQEKGGCFDFNLSDVRSTHRSYLDDTLVLQTFFETATGSATLTDFMPVFPRSADLSDLSTVHSGHRVVRVLECTSGSVEFRVRCIPRFDYGRTVPKCVLANPNQAFIHGGPQALTVYASPRMNVQDGILTSEGRVEAGQRCHIVLQIANHRYAAVFDRWDHQEVEAWLESTTAYWRKWVSRCHYEGPYRDSVVRSALTLKALTYNPSGGFVAAPTTSLPESIGGPRNWDYRYSWIRDAAFAVYALSILGYKHEAEGFERWLEWSAVGRAQDLQIMYGLGGERRLTETEIRELSGYMNSSPVRIGNGAYDQKQHDIYGEILDAAHLYRKYVGPLDEEYWEFLCQVVDHAINHWRDPDEGIWETRSGQQHFVFSKVMCWVAIDRAIKAARGQGLSGDVDRWVQVRREIREDVLAKGVDPDRGVFVQAYGNKLLDASNLMLPLVGFIKASDPRMLATIEATARELTSRQGFVYRYKDYDDGLAGHEGTFVLCTLWLADNFIKVGRVKEARDLFERVIEHVNDLGLLSEQIDEETGAQVGNFPQAFSHLAIISTAVQLASSESPAGRSY